jgi:hypothetical protein
VRGDNRCMAQVRMIARVRTASISERGYENWRIVYPATLKSSSAPERSVANLNEPPRD